MDPLGNGGRKSPPSGQQLYQQCPWHMEGMPHPGGAPECFTIPENIAMGRVIPLNHIVAWVAMLMTQAMPVLNELWLWNLASHGTKEEQAEAFKLLNANPEDYGLETPDKDADLPN